MIYNSCLMELQTISLQSVYNANGFIGVITELQKYA